MHKSLKKREYKKILWQRVVCPLFALSWLKGCCRVGSVFVCLAWSVCTHPFWKFVFLLYCIFVYLLHVWAVLHYASKPMFGLMARLMSICILYFDIVWSVQLSLGLGLWACLPRSGEWGGVADKSRQSQQTSDTDTLASTHLHCFVHS